MKIKISLELEGDEFKYDWEIGGERQGGSMPFGSDHFEFLCSVIATSKRVKAFKKMMADENFPKLQKEKPCLKK
jgi:hypothetical protein